MERLHCETSSHGPQAPPGSQGARDTVWEAPDQAHALDVAIAQRFGAQHVELLGTMRKVNCLEFSGIDRIQ